MRASSVWTIIVVIVSLALACGPAAAPSPSPQVKVPAAASVPRTFSEQEWQDAVAAARKEGTIVLYTATGPALRDVVTPPFSEKYGIRIDFLIAKGAELAEKMTRERQGGIYAADIWMGGNTTMVNQLKPRGFLDTIEPVLLLPEVRNPAVWWGNRLNFVDKDRMVLAFTTEIDVPLGLNTDLVGPGEIKSYRDLLLPKWKGKLLLNDPTVAGSPAEWYGMVSSKIMSVDFMRQLAKQEPAIVRDLRLTVEWLAKGKHPVTISPHVPTFNQFKTAGAPLAAFVPEEGGFVKPGSGNVVLINKAPHPNAARLFINWLLTKEAQLLWQKAVGTQSARLDVSPALLDQLAVRQEGAKYLVGGDEEFLLSLPDKMKEAKEIFGSLTQ